MSNDSDNEADTPMKQEADTNFPLWGPVQPSYNSEVKTEEDLDAPQPSQNSELPYNLEVKTEENYLDAPQPSQNSELPYNLEVKNEGNLYAPQASQNSEMEGFQNNFLTTATSLDAVLPSPPKQLKCSYPDDLTSTPNIKRGMPLFTDSEIDKYDIGRFLKIKLPSSELYNVIENIWKPDEAFEYPVTLEGNGEKKRSKHFRKEWLKAFGWISYSKLYDGAFCVPCVLFGVMTGHSSGKLQALYTSPLTYWSSAFSKFRDHDEICKLHRASLAAMERFRAIWRGRVTEMNMQVNKLREERNNQNLKTMLPIIKTVAFCGRQNIPLSGVNFQELLNFRIDSGDTILKDHFEMAPKYATREGKTIQNEVIDSIGRYIQEQIIKEVKNAKYFSLVIDGAPNVSLKEQMPLSLRYVDKEGCVKEKFVTFIECGTCTVEAIANSIKVAISMLGLSLENVRGQGYDGACKMSGVARLIQGENKRAIYIHSFAHFLNLCVAASCQLQGIKNMMDTVRRVSEFFTLPKRTEFLKSQVMQYTPCERQQNLLDVCGARWITRIDGLHLFEEMFQVIMITLQSIRDDFGSHWSDDSRNEAGSLFNACSEFTFLMSLVTTRYFLYLLLPLTAGLQEQELEIVQAYKNISLVEDALNASSSSINRIHNDLYERAVHLADYVAVKPSKPRTCKLVENCNNRTTVEDIKAYYQVSLTKPFLEHLIQEIKYRFVGAPNVVVKGFTILPAYFINQTTNDWESDFMQFIDCYANDLPSSNCIQPELLLWETFWRKEANQSLPSSLSATMKIVNKMQKSFPNIYAVLRLLSTVPVTSCKCKRDVSLLHELKTYLRSSMEQGRLNSLALMSIHDDIKLDHEEILTRFVRRYPQRMQLVNLFSD